MRNRNRHLSARTSAQTDDPSKLSRRRSAVCGLLRMLTVVAMLSLAFESGIANEMERIRVSDDGHSFIDSCSGRRFVPWGFNYDHDARGRLLEDYWTEEWKSVVSDFREMKQLGANVVRIHLQFGRFMNAADRPNEKSLNQLGRLLKLAEQTGLYLDLTGLGCYHKQDVPAWYDALDETGRWRAQAHFWTAVADRSAESPAVFCYDLMNEPVVPGGKKKRSDWLGPPFAGNYFVQFITLQRGHRSRPEIARAWIHRLATAIRAKDRRHLITLGLVPWSLDRPGLTSGFVPKQVIGDLDFISVHIYPRSGHVGDALKTVKGFSVGKPVLIEEVFPLKCSLSELETFINRSRLTAVGWIGFYWGRTPRDYRKSSGLRDALMAEWLEFFQKHAHLR